MRRVCYVVGFVAVVGVLWMGSFGGSGGEQDTGRFYNQFCVDATRYARIVEA